ncbi:kelch-like protein 6 [Littorina saxatilis]|uniref:BTB domain-containing protein n=1 Tax=Littorina saxatilis TaxID=31220 RepID=A0AAN9GPZ4_9CAEN
MAEEPSGFQVKVMANICQGIDGIYNETLLCDLKVTVGHVTFECHRLVLAAVSGFFQALMSSSWAESRKGEVKIEHEDVTPESFQMLLDILYKTEEVITKETATDVLRMAIFLQVKFLEEHCLAYLDTNMTPDVCVGTWMFAEKYQLPALAQRASDMASDQIDQVVEHDEILQLPKAMLLIMLGSQRKLSMDDLCRTILRWVEEEPEARQPNLSELLPFVSFPQLSPVYISELMNYYFDHPFRKYMAKNINDAVSFNLVGQKQDLKRQILAQQDRVATSDLIHKCAVVVGGCTQDDKIVDEVWAFRADAAKPLRVYPLKSVPESCGIHFASCTWRNELYISGGTKEVTYFAKYKPGYDDWEVLPDMKHGFEKHAMAAVNGNIYVIGGLSLLRKKSSYTVLVYSIGDKSWSKLNNRLPLAVQDASAAVLGHRIYIFGGREGAKKPVDVVQCLDTNSGCAYIAGSLPYPCGEVIALSDGGTIYLLCEGTKVLKMRENFSIADRKEKQAQEMEPEEKAVELVAETKDKAKEKEGQALTTEESSSASVSFKEVGSFPDVSMLSAFLHNGEMVACEAQSQDGKLLKKSLAMNLTTGEMVNKNLVLGKRLKNFQLQTLNIPNEYLTADKANAMFAAVYQVGLH